MHAVAAKKKRESRTRFEEALNRSAVRQVLAIIHKDIRQWTRRPMYFVASVALAVLVLSVVGNTMAGATNLPFGLYDPAGGSDLAALLQRSKRLLVHNYVNLDEARQDLVHGRILALASVSDDPLVDSVQILTEGHNILIQGQIYVALMSALTSSRKEINLPWREGKLFPANFSLRDYVTPGLTAYLCYVLGSYNVGFSWIYEWMERTFRRIILAPHGLEAAIAAKTFTVTLEGSVVLLVATVATAPVVGYTLGTNPLGLVATTVLSVFCFTCIGLAVACAARTIRVYNMVASITGVALMFVSGVVVPIEAMPTWEQIGARFFPMYYSADAFRGVMLGTPADYSRDASVLLTWSSASLLAAVILLYRRKAALLQATIPIA